MSSSEDQQSPSIFLTNRRLFAYALKGVPRDIKCDNLGNVYAACGDGLEIWSPQGIILGVIESPGKHQDHFTVVLDHKFLTHTHQRWGLRFLFWEQRAISLRRPTALVATAQTSRAANYLEGIMKKLSGRHSIRRLLFLGTTVYRLISYVLEEITSHYQTACMQASTTCLRSAKQCLRPSNLTNTPNAFSMQILPVSLL
jgi:hypothetical protein